MVRATVDGVDGQRYYDGLAEKPDGTYVGIEVKSATGTPTKAQEACDGAVSQTNPATATLNGQTIRITAVRNIKT